MGKKRRRLNSSKFVEKNSSWREAVLKTKELTDRIEKVTEAVAVVPEPVKTEVVSATTAKKVKKAKTTTSRRKTSKTASKK